MNPSTHATLPKGCTNFKVRQFARLLSRYYDAGLAGTGLKITQYALMSHVLNLGPVAPGELARQMGLEASSVTRNIQPLVATGWLVQVAGDDARSRRIAITPAGREKLAEVRNNWKIAQLGINALLGVERVLALHGLLDECTSLLQAGEPKCVESTINEGG